MDPPVIEEREPARQADHTDPLSFSSMRSTVDLGKGPRTANGPSTGVRLPAGGVVDGPSGPMPFSGTGPRRVPGEPLRHARERLLVAGRVGAQPSPSVARAAFFSAGGPVEGRRFH